MDNTVLGQPRAGHRLLSGKLERVISSSRALADANQLERSGRARAPSGDDVSHFPFYPSPMPLGSEWTKSGASPRSLSRLVKLQGSVLLGRRGLRGTSWNLQPGERCAGGVLPARPAKANVKISCLFPFCHKIDSCSQSFRESLGGIRVDWWETRAFCFPLSQNRHHCGQTSLTLHFLY